MVEVILLLVLLAQGCFRLGDADVLNLVVVGEVMEKTLDVAMGETDDGDPGGSLRGCDKGRREKSGSGEEGAHSGDQCRWKRFQRVNDREVDATRRDTAQVVRRLGEMGWTA